MFCYRGLDLNGEYLNLDFVLDPRFRENYNLVFRFTLEDHFRCMKQCLRVGNIDD